MNPPFYFCWHVCTYPMATAVVIPKCGECNDEAATAKPSGKLCTANEINKSHVTRQARRASVEAKSCPDEYDDHQDNDGDDDAFFFPSVAADRSFSVRVDGVIVVVAFIGLVAIIGSSSFEIVLADDACERIRRDAFLVVPLVEAVFFTCTKGTPSSESSGGMASSNPKMASGSGKAHLDKSPYKTAPTAKLATRCNMVHDSTGNKIPSDPSTASGSNEKKLTVTMTLPAKERAAAKCALRKGPA